MKTFSEFMDYLLEDELLEAKHLAYLNGVKTHAKKMGGKWTVGGDFPQSGDKVSIAAKSWKANGDLAWHTLKGSHLKFDDVLTDEEKKEHHALNEDVVPFTHGEHHVGDEVKINKPGHPMHGKTGYIGNSSSIPGHSAWEGHNPESEHHSVHMKDGDSFKEKDVLHVRHLTLTGNSIHTEESLNEDIEFIDEARKYIIRFRAGKRQRKLMCGKGYRNVGNRCVKQSSLEVAHRRRGHIRSSRKIRARGAGGRRRSNIKRQRTMLRRHGALGHR
jgi:hypothetical protein